MQSDANTTLAGCADTVQGAGVVFQRARATLADWRPHIDHREALRAGTLDPAHALELWQQVYMRAGPAISRYAQAYEGFAAGHGCDEV